MLGTVLANRYSLTRIIGSGGMGDIYEARRLSDGARVAVKVLREELAREIEAVTRFHREVRAAAALKSRFAARILDFGEGGKQQPFMVMEYLEGRDLMAEIEARGAIPFVEAARYLMQACEAMAEAHQLGIVHRDLKPPNLFLAQEGGAKVVKVLDFGISKVHLWDSHITSTKMSFGSPLYMSPEQIRSTKLVDARSDVWSLGVIFYEAITGEPPFVADSPSGLAVIISVDPHIPPTTRNPNLPKRVDDIIASVLQKDPSTRMQSVQAMFTALSELVREAGATEPPIDPQPASAGVRPIVVHDRRAITLGPATTDPPAESAASERLGRLAAAVLIPFGALAVVVTIWLFVNKSSAPTGGAPTQDRTTGGTTETPTAHPVTMPTSPNTAGVVASSSQSAIATSASTAPRPAKPGAGRATPKRPSPLLVPTTHR